MLRAMHPHFLRERTFGGVIAVEGVECADFDPTRQEIGWGRAVETADVVADEGDAAESEVH